DGEAGKAAPNPARDALLSEAAARLLWLYHAALPHLIAETRFDAGKLMARFTTPPSTSTPISSAEDAEGGAGGLGVLTQLHTLRLLHETDDFVWTGKIAGRSHLHTLLTLYTTTPTPALRAAARGLVTKLLGQSSLFQHQHLRSEHGDEDEVGAWLDAIPRRGRKEVGGDVGGEGDEEAGEDGGGGGLKDERAAVAAFLDECVMRALKTPYRYMDDLAALLHREPGEHHSPEEEEGGGGEEEENLTPLLATLIEQLRAKISGKLLSASDMLALATYARGVVFELAARGRSLNALERVGRAIAGAFEQMRPVEETEGEGEEGEAVRRAAKREAQRAARCAELIGHARPEADQTQDEEDEDEEQTTAVRQFLTTVESLPASDIDPSELVHWLRLLRSPLGARELGRVVRLIVAHAGSGGEVVREMWDAVPLERSPLSRKTFWEDVGDDIGGTAPFGVMFVHATKALVRDEKHRARMARAARGEPERALNLICHRLDVLRRGREGGEEDEVADLVLLLSAILAGVEEREGWKVALFEKGGVRALLGGTPGARVRHALTELLATTLSPRSPADTALLAPFTARGALDGMTRVFAPYMRADEARAILSLLVRAPPGDEEEAKEFAGVLVRTLRRALSVDAGAVDARTVEELIGLHVRYPDMDVVEQVIASALSACVPSGLTGPLQAHFELENTQTTTIGALASTAENRWRNRTAVRDWTQSAEIFLRREPHTWTDESVAILECMAYLDAGARGAVGRFVGSARAEEVEGVYLAKLLHAVLDSSDESSSDMSIGDERVVKHFGRILDVEDTQDTLALITRRFPALEAEFARALSGRIGRLSKKSLPAGLVYFAERWCDAQDGEAGEACAAVLDHGLRWAAHALASPQALDGSVLSALGRLGTRVPVKAHLVDVVLAAVVQNRMDDGGALDFVEGLVGRAQMKPVIVNRHIQSIVQHADFYRHIASSSPSRRSLVNLTHTLFHLHPSNTCQPSHIQPLVPAYTGSRSPSDRRIFGIFRLYEETRKVSVAPLFGQRSAADRAGGTCLQVLLGLDASQVFRTCLAFPARAKETVFAAGEGGAPFAAEQVYEPAFVVALLGQALVGDMPRSALEWVAFFRTNVVCVAIRCLSSEDGEMRGVAVGCLAAVRRRMDAVDMQEGPQAKYVLDLLKDAVKLDPDTEHYTRINAFTTLLLAHALRAIFFPANFIYPLTSRFLLQRPELDTSDVPLLYSMLHSGADEWKRERAWMLKYLADAMLGAGQAEWEVFRRRRTWDLLASLWQNDRAVRAGVLDVLVNLTAGRHIVTSLILKSGLLAWAEMVLLAEAQGGLERVWLAVLENVLMVADVGKLDAATGGEWRAALGRCLALLVRQQGLDLGVLVLQSRVLLRLTQLPGRAPHALEAILSSCVDKLAISEQKIKLELPMTSFRTNRAPTMLLHSSLDAHNENEDDDVSRWCDVVSNLWSVSMTLGATTGNASWARLTPRMLARTSLLGGGARDEEGEWVRRQVVASVESGTA
ncbi:unnamed protein product, partial [Peniophora sp. CBMAI 1063]